MIQSILAFIAAVLTFYKNLKRVPAQDRSELIKKIDQAFKEAHEKKDPSSISDIINN